MKLSFNVMRTTTVSCYITIVLTNLWFKIWRCFRLLNVEMIVSIRILKLDS